MAKCAYGISDSLPSNMYAQAGKLGIPKAYGSYEEMLADLLAFETIPSLAEAGGLIAC